jgi:hypothetical protein
MRGTPEGSSLIMDHHGCRPNENSHILPTSLKLFLASQMHVWFLHWRKLGAVAYYFRSNFSAAYLVKGPSSYGGIKIYV